MSLGAYFRLANAGFVLTREGALSIVDNAALVKAAGIPIGGAQ